MLGPIELPVTLTVGDPATAEPVPLGSIHVAMRPAGGLLDGGWALLVPVDPDDMRHQLGALLTRHADTLRRPPTAEEVPGAAAPR